MSRPELPKQSIVCNHQLQPLSVFEPTQCGHMVFSCCEATPDGAVEEVQALRTVDLPKIEPASATPTQAAFTFQLPDNSSKEVIFTEKPLGLDFSKSLPMTVKAVRKDSVSHAAGIEARWVLTHIGREAIPSDLKEAMEKILEAVRELPQK
ncbi:unnamed protein product [Effrenium voratum]|uniref:Uncharacterized protein n=1 Tax=Effrenium voratum TaxID=2562239 RepID=A0AA36NL28_9DINO|nr:unnamed protein product [Effrenium voratum]CAJ1411562.1 unnamed protein product [Effrenium voratum]CAJ1454786.1 unnamed protein product [Effrenium voratum]